MPSGIPIAAQIARRYAPSRVPALTADRAGDAMCAPVLMALFAFLFVSSAWVVIFAAMTSAHSAASNYAYDVPSPFNADASQGCAISMEMYPVTYTDERGRRATAWETDVRNCWGGSTRVSSLPSRQPQRAFGSYTRASYRY